MSIFRLQILIWGIVFFAFDLSGQETDTAFLGTVTVVDTYMPDSSQRSWSPGQLNLGSTLFAGAGIYLRSNGPGSLSTLSYKGNAPHQLPVLWQGINLQNSMNGVMDLSLLPAHFYNTELSNDVESALGHGRNNHALSLQTVFKPESFILIGAGAGMYGNRQIYSSGHLNSKWGHLHVNFSFEDAQNNFLYRDITKPAQPMKNLENAHTSMLHTGVDYFVEYQKHSFGLHMLYSAADREIPPSLTEINQMLSQQDSSFKITGIYKYQDSLRSISYQPAWIFDKLYYSPDRHLTHSLVHQFKFKQYWPLSIATDINYILEDQIVYSSAYAPEKIRNQRHDIVCSNTWESGFGLSAFWINRWSVQAKFKSVCANQGGIQYQHEKFNSSLRVGRSYQFPTLNDLYWPLAGNLNLKPEKSDFVLIDLDYTFPLFTILKVKPSLSYEWKKIDDYILWRPVTGNFWSPQNVKKVDIKCLDLFLNLRLPVFNQLLIVQTNVQWLKARPEAVYDASQQGALGKQLIYTPESQWRNQVEWQLIQNWFFKFNHTYIGSRSTTRDNSHVLQPIHLLSVVLRKQFTIRKILLNIGAQAENLLNEQYQLIAFRPMPGTSVQLNLSITFKK